MIVEVFKRTSDYWYPNYEISHQKLVRVLFTKTGPMPPIDGKWRVCVWGSDDCGMEKDFTKEKEAWCCFLEVIGLKDVNMDALNGLGFVGA